jgi:hypothetical protein
MDWIDLAQDRDQWRGFLNTVMNLRVSYNLGKFFTQMAASEEAFSSMELVSSLIASDFLNNTLYGFLTTSMRVSCPAHLIPLGLVILLVVLFGEA